MIHNSEKSGRNIDMNSCEWKTKKIFLVKRNSGEIQSKNQSEHLKPI